LHKGLGKVLGTVEKVAIAYEDKKIVWTEWAGIGLTAVGWIWIFKNLPAIQEDLKSATEETMTALIEEIRVEFDIPQDKLEETIEQALSIILLFLAMLENKSLQNVG